jgi:Na+/pantothenate symporter
MTGAIISFLAYTVILATIGIWSYKIVEKVPISKYEEEFYAAGRGLGGIVVSLPVRACATPTATPG